MSLPIRLHPKRASVELRHTPPEPKKRIRKALRVLAQDPLGREAGLDVRRLRSDPAEPDFYRLRVGDWRVVYTFDTEAIHVSRIVHRREGYDWFDRLDKTQWPFGPG